MILLAEEDTASPKNQSKVQYNSSDTFMAVHWPEIALVDFAFKLLFSALLTLPLYGLLLRYLSRRIKGLSFNNSGILFTPFKQ